MSSLVDFDVSDKNLNCDRQEPGIMILSNHVLNEIVFVPSFTFDRDAVSTS